MKYGYDKNRCYSNRVSCKTGGSTCIKTQKIKGIEAISMIYEITEVCQTEFAKILKQYTLNPAKLMAAEDISFNLIIDSNRIMDLQYYVLMLNSLTKLCESMNVRKKIATNISSALGSDSGEMWGQINTYLSCFKDSLFSGQKVFEEKSFGKYTLTSSDKVAFSRIIPLIPISGEMLKFLSQRVEDAFDLSLVIDKSGKHFKCDYYEREVPHRVEKVDGTSHIKMKKVIDMNIYGLPKILDENNGNKVGKPALDNPACSVLFYACLVYLFQIDNRSKAKDYIGLLKERASYYSTSSFFEKVKDSSVLSFLIFCSYSRFNLIDKLDTVQKSDKYKNRNPKYSEAILEEVKAFPSDKEDEEILVNSLNMSDGLIQLIENAVHYAGKENGESKEVVATLSLRIYKDGQPSKDNVINHKYRRYFEGHDYRHVLIEKENGEFETLLSSFDKYERYSGKKISELPLDEQEDCIQNNKEIESRKRERKESAYHLEVCLLDNSGKNMSDVFLKNHEKDPSFPFNRYINIRTFFNPNGTEMSNWRVFNSQSENVIHHYGLQLFDAMIQSIDGCFFSQSIANGQKCTKDNFFSSSGDSIKDNKFFAGTQYSILLPFIEKENKQYSFINTNVEFVPSIDDYSLFGESELQPFISEINKHRESSYKSQDEKVKIVASLEEIIHELSLENNAKIIIPFDASGLTSSNMELFSKSLIKFIAETSKKSTNQLNIAIKNCSESVIRHLVRIFTVFYDRTGYSELLKGTQIHLSGKAPNDSIPIYEFLLAGSNIHNTLVAQIKLDTARGLTHETHGGMLSFLMNMLKKRPGSGDANSTIRYVPFDLAIKYNDISIFENNVYSMLNTNSQQRNPGCMIIPNHMRVGSKIHVDKFYEAKPLFENNYFTGRFAWMLKEQITLYINPSTSNTPYLFIGYETYSEILLRDLCAIIPNSKYVIFEYGIQDSAGKATKDRFRNLESIVSGGQLYQPIYIVPINSTLSTFNKLEASFGEAVNNSKIDIHFFSEAQYFGVIQTREGQDDTVQASEADFFIEPDMKNKTIKSKILSGKKTHHLFCVNASWSNPLICQLCYPPLNNIIEESPLIETDKTSVTPSQQYGIKQIKENSSKKMISSIKGHIKELHGVVDYRHTFRDSNDFQYYIQTDLLFKNSQKKIQMWLKDIKSKIASKNTIRYDIIVCPEHYSNSGFVKLVNEEVFGGASLLITIDSAKEYRDNFKTKHSDILNIIDNLRNQNGLGEINFHFVDDTIIHGTSFFRIKSLINSLIPKEGKGVVVNIFKSIIVLLNRNSNDSMQNYCTPHGTFYSYLDLHISSLRTHNNACVLCQEESEYWNLSKKSSLNNMRDIFYSKANRLHRYNVTEKNYTEGLDIESAYVSMVCTHYFNEALMNNPVKYYRINTLLILLKTMQDSLDKAFKRKNKAGAEKIPVPSSLTLIIEYIKIASSPFQSFKKSTREAIFKLILFLFELLLDPKLKLKKNRTTFIEDFLHSLVYVDLDEYDENICLEENKQDLFYRLERLCTEVFEVIKCSNNGKFKILNLLIEQSAALKSNYIIRRDNLIRLFWVGIDNASDEDFVGNYLSQIKRLISSGSDESKAMFLEFLILSGRELTNTDLQNGYSLSNEATEFGILEKRVIQEVVKKHFKLNDIDFKEKYKKFRPPFESFIRCLFLENIQISYDATKDIHKRKSGEEINDLYFLENYRLMHKWNSQEIQVNVENNLMVRLYSQLKTEYNQSDLLNYKYYEQLLGIAKKIIDADEAYLFMKDIRTGKLILLYPNNCYAPEEVLSHINNLSTKRASRSLADTLLYDETDRIQTLRFANHYDNSENFVCYLTFKSRNNQSFVKPSELLKVRELITFRSRIMKRLEKDFKNNHTPEYVELSDKVLKLSGEKTGSHTPFEELSDEFDLLYDVINSPIVSGISEKLLANQMKLIADSLISKLYVHSITNTLLSGIDDTKPEIYRLVDIKKILSLSNKLEIIDSDKLFPEIDWSGIDDAFWNELVETPQRTGFIWCAAFFALIINAIRHGYHSEEEKVIKICLENEIHNNVYCIKFSNKRQKNDNKKDDNGITLRALKYFFHSYGFTAFSDNTSDKNAEFFNVWLPIEKKEEDEDEKENTIH